MVERGPNLEHRVDYKTEFKAPWELPFRGFTDPADPRDQQALPAIRPHGRVGASDMFVDDDVDVYESPSESGFRWIRGYHLGGRSIMWAGTRIEWRRCTSAPMPRDGHGVPWPIGYTELAPWYEHAERFIGVNGTVEGDLPGLPDGIYQPSMGFNAAGKAPRRGRAIAHSSDRRVVPGRTANLTLPIGDRGPCHNRDQCARGCSFGALLQHAELTPAGREGNGPAHGDDRYDRGLLEYEPAEPASHGRAADRRAQQGDVGRAIDARVRLRRVDQLREHPASFGVGRRSGRSRQLERPALGKYLMDHRFGGLLLSTVPGIDDEMYSGRKPNGIIVPRWINVERRETSFCVATVPGGSGRDAWKRGGHGPGIGVALKQ